MPDVLPGVIDSVLGPRRVNVLSAGSLYQDVPCPEWYGRVAQPGDNVMCQRVSPAQLIVLMCTDDTDRLYIPPTTDFPTITVQGTAPAGMTQISGIYAKRPDRVNPDLTLVWASAPPAVPAAPVVRVFRPVTSGTRDSFYAGWRTDDDKVRQGTAEGATSPAFGLWFYGNPWGVLAGLTITRVQLRVERYDGVNGANAAVPLHVALHNHATRPVGSPTMQPDVTVDAIGKGQTLEVDLPTWYGDRLKAGTAKGVGLYTNGGDYLVALGASADSGVLIITTA